MKIFIACLFKGSQEEPFFLQTLFTGFLVTVLNILTYTHLWAHDTWSAQDESTPNEKCSPVYMWNIYDSAPMVPIQMPCTLLDDASGRYMTWWWSPTWKEVGPSLLDWVINRLLKSSPGSLSNVVDVDHRPRSPLSDVQRCCRLVLIKKYPQLSHITWLGNSQVSFIYTWNITWISPLSDVQRCPRVPSGGNLAAPRTSTDLSSLVNPSTPEFELRWLQRKTWPQQDTLFCHQGLSTRKNPANFLKSRCKLKR